MIKLKAVIKETKKIVEVSAIYFNSELVKIPTELSVGTSYGYYKFEDIILLKSTGLYDSKGVEIFEGDILEYENEFYQVVYELDNARFVATNLEDVTDYLMADTFTFTKIIGNIHTKEKTNEKS